jgi:hypothetical protein
MRVVNIIDRSVDLVVGGNGKARIGAGTASHAAGRLFLLVFLTLMMSCQPSSGAENDAAAGGFDLKSVLRVVEDGPGGWKQQEAVRVYDRDNLFDLMNGQSDSFFVYGFEQVAVQRFRNPDGVILMAAVFQVDAPDSAYGLFSANQDGLPVAVGNEGSLSPGQRLSFWQANYFVQLTVLKPIPDGELEALAQAISAVLPSGGERPALIDRLPAQGLQADPRPLYFHEELSIQDWVWLGGENVLGLGPDTNGVLARYLLDGLDVWLVVIEYPGDNRAAAARDALQAGPTTDLLAFDARGRRLAMIFGQTASAGAQELLASALE